MASTNSGTRAWGWWAAAIVVAVAIVAGVVIVNRPESKYSGPKGAPRVLVVGDSITLLARGAIENTLGSKVRLRFDARWGKRSDEMLSSLEAGLKDPAGPPAAVIVNLGTNDALQTRPTALENFLKVVQTAEKAPCVLLTTLNVRDDPAAAAVANRLDASMASVAAGQPDVRIVGWQQLIDSNDQLLLPGDKVHPNEAGRQALADLYLQTLQACPNNPVG